MPPRPENDRTQTMMIVTRCRHPDDISTFRTPYLHFSFWIIYMYHNDLLEIERPEILPGTVLSSRRVQYSEDLQHHSVLLVLGSYSSALFAPCPRPFLPLPPTRPTPSHIQRLPTRPARMRHLTACLRKRWRPSATATPRRCVATCTATKPFSRASCAATPKRRRRPRTCFRKRSSRLCEACRTSGASRSSQPGSTAS
jgi:hypothetical protein